MRHTLAPTVALLVIAVVACKQDEQAASPPPTATPMPPGSAAPPSPTPVALTADKLKPTCAKIFTAELATKTHGATEVKEQGTAGGPLAICQLLKDGQPLGSATIACNPTLDPTSMDRERGAMTKAQDLPAPIGRGGYRISTNFIVIDDETPCRIMVNWMTLPEDAALADALRAIVAAVNPTTLE